MVSLIDTLDALDIDGDPPSVDSQNPVLIGPTSIHLVSFWYRSDNNKPETGKCRYILVAPDGEEFGQQEVEIDLENTPSKHLIIGIPALQYVGLGYYYFLVEKMDQGENRWSRTARLPLLVRSQTKKD